MVVMLAAGPIAQADNGIARGQRVGVVDSGDGAPQLEANQPCDSWSLVGQEFHLMDQGKPVAALRVLAVGYIQSAARGIVSSLDGPQR